MAECDCNAPRPFHTADCASLPPKNGKVTLPGPRRLQFAARFGNWNDRRFGHHDSRSEATRLWWALDRISAWFYLRGW